MRGRGAAIAAAVAALVSVYVVARQPVRAPWWLYADPDATYTASSLNLLLPDGHSHYYGHPGVPEQDVLALTFASQHLLDRLDGGPPSAKGYVDARLGELESTRSVFRGWAIALFVGGALLIFALTALLLGHWWWGLIAGVLWVAAPDFATGSIQIRPDVALSLLSVATVFLVVRGAQRRDALAYLGAAALLGLALTVKLHAIGLAAPLLLAVLLKPPPRGWADEARERVSTFALRHARGLTALVLAWLLLVLVVNWHRVPFSATGEQQRAVLFPIAIVAIWFAAARFTSLRRSWRVADPFYPYLAAAFLAGIALPLSLFLRDGFLAAAEMWSGLTGGGAQQGVPLFTLQWNQFKTFPLREATALFVFAGAAAAVGLRRRSLTPLLWFVAAAVMGVMGAARLGALRYFEPAYVLSIPPALWLFARARGLLAPLAAALLAAVIVYPSLRNAHLPAKLATQDEAYAAAANATAAKLLSATDVALAADYAPIADVRYWGDVQNFVGYTPPHSYSFLPDYAPAMATAAAQGKQVRFYIGPAVVGLSGPRELQLAAGRFFAEPLPEAATPQFGVARLTPR